MSGALRVACLFVPPKIILASGPPFNPDSYGIALPSRAAICRYLTLLRVEILMPGQIWTRACEELCVTCGEIESSVVADEARPLLVRFARLHLPQGASEYLQRSVREPY